MVDNLTPEEHKAIIKEAFKEWLDEKVLAFGHWSIRFIGTAVCGTFIYWAAQHGILK